VNIEAHTVEGLQEEHSAFLNKTEVLTETEIGNSVPDDEQAEEENRYPKKNEYRKPFGFLDGNDS